MHAALDVGRHFCDFPGVAFHGLCYGLPSVLGAPGVLVHQAGQLGQLVIRPQLPGVPWNLLFGTPSRPIANRDVTPIGVVVRSLFVFWFLSIRKIRITVVPGFRVLGFRVLGFRALPGFRALNPGDGAWLEHDTLFEFRAPLFWPFCPKLSFRGSFWKKY